MVGREVKPSDNGYISDIHDRTVSDQQSELPDFDRTNISTLRAKSGSVVTQLQYARQGMITPEMEFIAIRENMKLQNFNGDLEVADLIHDEIHLNISIMENLLGHPYLRK